MGRRILEEYSILGNKVSIIDDDGRGLYIVEKKKSDNTEQNIVNSILDEVYFSSKTTTEAESKLIEIITKKNLDRSLTEKAMYELKKRNCFMTK